MAKFGLFLYIFSCFVHIKAEDNSINIKCDVSVNTGIQICVGPVAKYAEVLNMGVQAAANKSKAGMESFGIPKMGEKVFKDLCGLIRRFNVCVRDARKKCPSHVTLRLIDASYGYLCTEGYRIFMDNADCLMELDRQDRVKECHDRTLRSIKTANEETNIDMNSKMLRMCDALNYFARCVKDPVLSRCGNGAWTVIVRVLRDTTQTLMPTCPFEVAVMVPDNNRLLQSAAADNGMRPTTRIITNTFGNNLGNQPWDIARTEALKPNSAYRLTCFKNVLFLLVLVRYVIIR